MAGQTDYVLGYLSDIDLRLLRIFATIVECGGVTAAEAQLNMANSTLSTHLASLEDRLQVKLCRRGRGGFSLTPEGQHVYDASRRMFQSVDEFRNTVHSLRADVREELRISVPDSLIVAVIDELAPVLRRFTQERPKVFINIGLAAPADIDQLVIDGKIDIGISSSSRRTHNLSFVDIKQELEGLYCGAGHPLFERRQNTLSVAEVVEHATVRAHGYYYPKNILKALRGSATASSIPIDGRVLLLATGRYLGILPTDYARPFVEQGLLRELLPRYFGYTNRISVITLTGSENASTRHFLELLQAGQKKTGKTRN